MADFLREIKGYENIYAVSDTGKVWSIRNKRYLTPRDDGRGYLAVDLRLNGGRETKKIHRLVAESFIGRDGEERHHINHKDGNKLNNQVSNLEWCTPLENTRHAMSLGLVKNRLTNKGYFGESSCGRVKLHFQSLEDAERFGFDGSSISKCCYGKRKEHKGFKWLHIVDDGQVQN